MYLTNLFLIARHVYLLTTDNVMIKSSERHKYDDGRCAMWLQEDDTGFFASNMLCKRCN